MRNVSLFLAACFMLTACDAGLPPEGKGSLNYSDSFKYRQMAASLKALPPDKNIDSYTHFHPSELIEDRARMIINIYEVINDKDVEYLSIGCDTASVCGDILNSALEHAIIKGLYRNNMTLILPDYLEPPYYELKKLGIKVLIYKIQF